MRFGGLLRGCIGLFVLAFLSAPALAGELASGGLIGAVPRGNAASDAPVLAPVAFSDTRSDVDARDGEAGASPQDVTRRDLRIAKGDTLMSVLLDAGVARAEAAEAIAAMARLVNLRKLRIGQAITLYTSRGAAPARRLLIGLTLDIGRGRGALVYRELDHRFTGRKLATEEARELLDSIVVIADRGSGGLITRDLKLGRKQTLIKLLIDAGADHGDALAAAKALGRETDLRKLRIGQKFTATFDQPGGEGTKPRLSSLAFHKRKGADLVVARRADGGFGIGLADVAATAPAPDPAAERRDFRLRKGDSLFSRIVKLGASRRDTDRAEKALGKIVNVRRLQIGQDVVATFAPTADGDYRLAGLALSGGKHDGAAVGRHPDGRFKPGAPRVAALTPPAPDPSVAEAPVPVADAGPDSQPAPEPTPVAAPARVSTAPVHGVSTAFESRVVLRVDRGDTLTGILRRGGASRTDAQAAIRSLRTGYDPDQLWQGQRIVVRIDTATNKLAGFAIEVNGRRAIFVDRKNNDRFVWTRTRHAALAEQIELIEDIAFLNAVSPAAGAPAALNKPPSPFDGLAVVDLSGALRKKVEVARGGTLAKALADAGCDREESHAAIKAVRAVFNPRKLKAGQTISVAFIGGAPGDAAMSKPRLAGLTIDLGPEERLEVVRLDDGGFASSVVEKQLRRELRRAEGAIASNLYNAASAAGLPAKMLPKLVRVFSYDVDFQRDIQKGDRFEVLFEVFVDEAGKTVRTGAILFAGMTLSGTTLPFYRFAVEDGYADYFDDRGHSARKALMRTPIDGARLTSRFGKRKHPVLGYSKMHRGVDFAARRGTPIFAAGDGVVERASRWGAYGKYIRLRHGPDYGTAYAHLKAYAKGIYPGKRVKQGQIIGYVGSTGRSTGPHLHYEVLRNGRRVNPLSIKLPTGFVLTGDDMTRFAAVRDRLANIYASLPSRRMVAEAPSR